MFTFLRAGLTAASLQFAAVITVTALALPLRDSLVDASTPGAGADVARLSAPRLLVFVYLLIAAVFAMTHNRSIALTAERIHQASRRMSPLNPRRASEFLLVQSGFTAALFAVVALRTPPDLLIEAGRTLGCDGAASQIWAGVMSAGAASFGATAHAAFKAL